MTIEIETQGQVVTKAPPIARKFIGLHSAKLVRWMSYQKGTLRIEELP